MNKNEFKCCVCGEISSYDDSPMLLDEIWSKVWTGENGCMCLACIEERLGRAVTEGDLMLMKYMGDYVHVPWNSKFIENFIENHRYGMLLDNNLILDTIS